MMLADIRRIVPFTLPLVTRFRRVDHRRGLLLEGPAGWGEFSPFDDYGPAAAASWLMCALEAACLPPPTALRDEVAVNTTVPAVDPPTARALVSAAGCRTAKVKVAEPGQALADDVERVAAVRDALGVDGRVRIDANGAWDVASAVLAIARLDRAAGGLEYVEQPCRTIAELAEVRHRVDVPIAADESVRTVGDPLRVVRADAADVLVVKAQPMGGVRRILELAAEVDRPLVVSSAVESSVGLAVGVWLAAALPALPYDCGLGTATLLAADLTATPLAPRGGRIPVGPCPPDEGGLRAARPSAADEAALYARLREVAVELTDERDALDAVDALVEDARDVRSVDD